MINVMNQVKTPMNEVKKNVDPQLFHACAGGMVQIPPLNSKVFYFPQGHYEHAATGNINSCDSPRIPPYILCRVSAINFMAEPDTDEVYAKIALIPNHDYDSNNNNDLLGFDHNKNNNNNNQENHTSFAKTLTQSDANNGGGFSVPRYCAETIFPRLDYTADPPVQNILVKDVQGRIWKFRHIYRGTPRRHLLTTGWSSFVNHKKLVAGDSIVFLRADNGDLCVGIRRAKRGIHGGGFFGVKTENEKKGKLVIEAVNLAANGREFEVFYYPRVGTPEFVVKASVVMAAMRVQWCRGMRFKMAFETEDSSRISWFMGTICSVNADDQIRWPSSPWRLLEVSWDEPDLLQNIKRVNPWLVELVPNTPLIHLSPFSPPRKKLQIPQPPDFPLYQIPISPPLGQIPISPLIATNNIPASIQGARHNSQNFGSDLYPQFNKIQSLRTFPLKFKETTKETDEKVSCLLTIGSNNYSNPSFNKKNDEEKDKRKPVFVLFGRPILTEQQLSESWSGDGSVVLQNGPVESSSDEAVPWFKEQKPEFGLEPGFMNP